MQAEVRAQAGYGQQTKQDQRREGEEEQEGGAKRDRLGSETNLSYIGIRLGGEAGSGSPVPRRERFRGGDEKRWKKPQVLSGWES